MGLAAALGLTPVVHANPQLWRIEETIEEQGAQQLTLVVQPDPGAMGDSAMVLTQVAVENYIRAHAVQAGLRRAVCKTESGREVLAAEIGRDRRVEPEVDGERAEMAVGPSLAETPPGVSLDPSAAARRSAPEAVKVALVLQAAEALIGTPLAWGADPSAGFCDPATFVAAVYRRALGYRLPATLDGLWESTGVSVPVWDMRPGDLVILDRGELVGIYLGADEMAACDPAAGEVIRLHIGPESGLTARIADVRRLF
ncbi:C40 family peptidase [Alicyclobacillus mali]|uniref:C40 family peptidase n=1 Tax=Alicyclobacillus mali (ex Roth et al. 2021) TaxID=1123961 RepID=A0ABS0F0Y7_9BACL|nr:NlpC/P60 family protein [Alicyclobacillus mali (ex Roth et al. 2021)]MBF8376945.1 C40 family peptidase [Alicyclobacillus mali (ex Roth et al. 2021)]